MVRPLREPPTPLVTNLSYTTARLGESVTAQPRHSRKAPLAIQAACCRLTQERRCQTGAGVVAGIKPMRPVRRSSVLRWPHPPAATVWRSNGFPSRRDALVLRGTKIPPEHFSRHHRLHPFILIASWSRPVSPRASDLQRRIFPPRFSGPVFPSLVNLSQKIHFRVL